MREVARRHIDAIVHGKDVGTDVDVATRRAVEAMSPPDRALFKMITQGVLREWFFLTHVTGKLVRSAPKTRVQVLMNIAAFQLLFLDRVPEHAVFSEMKRSAGILKLSIPETKFLHGVLKNLQRQKDEVLSTRADALSRIEDGGFVDSDYDLALLNTPRALFDVLSDAKGKNQASLALLAMKKEPALTGFYFGGAKGAPMTVREKDLEEALFTGFVVLSESSQRCCLEVATQIVETLPLPSGKKFRILEMAAGKGGKLLGTIRACEHLVGTENLGRIFAQIEWVSTDKSADQLKLLRESVERHSLLNGLRINMDVIDWTRPGDVSELGQFDIVWNDAPCTGFGTLAKLPEIAITRGAEAKKRTAELATLQHRMARSALPLLKADGLFVHSVCTLTEPETSDFPKALENELVLRDSFSIWPNPKTEPNAEGFFYALLRKNQRA